MRLLLQNAVRGQDNREVTPRQIVLFYLILMGLPVILMGLRKRRREPTKLNLRAKSRIGESDVSGQSKTMQNQPESHEKALNVFFNYNGHSWDAYEVLGVPAGSSFEAVTEIFEKLRQNSGIDTRPFIDAAYEAILNEQNR